MNLSPSELFQAHVKNLKKVGSQGQYVGLCPFHDDQNPSLSVNIPSTLWNCHAGCGGGDAAEFARRLNLDPKPYYGNKTISIPNIPYIPLSKNDIERAKYFEKYLQVNWESIETPKPWTKAGCKYITGYDPKTNRFVFLHHDKYGKLLNLKWHKNGDNGYSLPGHGGCRWYPLLYIGGYDPEETLVICEGEPDVNSLIGGEIQALTATTGAGSIPTDMSILEPFKLIVVMYDNDNAGIDGAIKMVGAIRRKYPNKEVRLNNWKK